MKIKEQLYNQCALFVEEKLQTIKNKIQEIQESLTSETKSSAGDKHETGRAMLQLEREKIGQQLAGTQKLKEVLSKVDASKTSKTISLGSVIYTTQNNYFVAISAGELKIDNISFYAISANTPIGKLLLGKTVGDVFSFREQAIKIKKVF
ncbi:3-oxoacyl-ACP synthase [Oceanihabitans sp. 2_MG-2023]|uniref:3-oxoacyl-ACP synthase n=1 Tax=Oceanihabitans sp. 2_MG-2023 TaxID=3062661 RepID=UPI0026E2B52A|nr:3-oxoacyl-ACP synthase [Oceanihabitans sp. 2_MG-2023]MDO6595795.1 3-oxoacyl-ACP synthase [Oceanihabitans sp. 2_MG-2023]